MKLRNILLSTLYSLSVVATIPFVSSYKESKAADNFISMSQIANYLSKQEEHYPISDAFIEDYQQKSGGYIDYAKELGVLVDKSQHSPNQKWHFFVSWLYQSIDQGTLTWNESASNRVYSKLLCPELLLWIYEACGVDTTKIEQARDIAVSARVNNTALTTMASNIRNIISWNDLYTGISQGLSDTDPYHVNLGIVKDESKSILCTTTGIKYEGYQPGDTVTFTVDLVDKTKAISSVKLSNSGVLTDLGNDSYSFTMPSSDVDIQITLKDGDKPIEDDDKDLFTIVDLDFPVAGQGSVSRYDKTFTASNNGYEFSISHANNNSNKWDYIGIGMKASNNTAEIYNNAPIVEGITKVKLDISACNYSGIDSAKLLIADNSAFTSAVEVDVKALIPQTAKPGVVSIPIPEINQKRNQYYKLVFNTNYSPNANGFIHIDQIKFLSTEINSISSLSIEGTISDLVVGDAFNFTNVVNGTCSISGTKVLTDNLIFMLNGLDISINDVITTDYVGDNVPFVVSYLNEASTLISTDLIYIDVNYKEVTSITLDKNECELNIGESIVLTATIADEYADPNVSWSSSDASIATVDEYGVVTANKAGEVIITVTATGGKTAACVTKVKNNLISSNNIGLIIGISVGTGVIIASLITVAVIFKKKKAS